MGGLTTKTGSSIGVEVSRDWIDVFDPRKGRYTRHGTSAASLAGFARAARRPCRSARRGSASRTFCREDRTLQA